MCLWIVTTSNIAKAVSKYCFPLLVLVTCFTSCSATMPANLDNEPRGYTLSSVESIIDDMRLRHEGTPHGVPAHWDWANGPKVGLGNNPGKFKEMIATGKVYEDIQGNPAKNTRVHIKNLKAYYLSKKDRQWRLLQQSRSVEGAAFREDFSKNYSKRADIRRESDDGVSVKAGGGFSFHFWSSSGRVPIDPYDIIAIFVTVQARLTTDDVKLPDDRKRARYLLSVGGDYWLSREAKWDNLKTNNDIALGRFKYVTAEWRSFNMTTLTEYEIRQSPPPLE